MRTLESFDRPRPAWPPPTIVGTVALWGRVIEHDHGWRAAYAYPSRVAVVCSMCAWFEPGPGDPTVVHRFAGCSYALCDVHRGGSQVPDGRRTEPTDIDPLDLLGGLLDRYAVDRLPRNSVQTLFTQPRTADPPPYFPTISVVPEARGADG
jgi:hypothetical protein